MNVLLFFISSTVNSITENNTHITKNIREEYTTTIS
jgi:hypothetical protein